MTDPRSKRRIVVADDMRFWREKVCSILKSLGHEVIAVDSGEIAIRLCINPSEPVDLLLVDLVMPDVDGFQVAHYLRAQRLTADLPIIAMTNVFKPADFPRGCRVQGFDAILEKASSPDQFLFIINKYLHAGLPSRRPAERVPSYILARIRNKRGHEGKCVVTNLSATGAFISTSIALALGEPLVLSLLVPDGPPIQAASVVAWVNDPKLATQTCYSRGVGVRFEGLDDESARRLATLLEKERDED